MDLLYTISSSTPTADTKESIFEKPYALSPFASADCNKYSTKHKLQTPKVVALLCKQFIQNYSINNILKIRTFQAEYNFLMRDINVSMFNVIVAIFL
jgi:hypothetical protein